MNYNTYFYDEREYLVASFPGLVPFTVGTMLKTKEGSYIIDASQFNLDNHGGDEELGLQYFCKTNTRSE